MFTKSFYRIHNLDYIENLLVPEAQVSDTAAATEETQRRGVSACESIWELAAYFSISSLAISNETLVKMTGTVSDDQPLDKEYGEVLIFPETYDILDIDFYEIISPLVDAVWENGWGPENFREISDLAYDLFIDLD